MCINFNNINIWTFPVKKKSISDNNNTVSSIEIMKHGTKCISKYESIPCYNARSDRDSRAKRANPTLELISR